MERKHHNPTSDFLDNHKRFCKMIYLQKKLTVFTRDSDFLEAFWL